MQSDLYLACLRYHAEGEDIPSWMISFVISLVIFEVVGWSLILGYLIACWFG